MRQEARGSSPHVALTVYRVIYRSRPPPPPPPMRSRSSGFTETGIFLEDSHFRQTTYIVAASPAAPASASNQTLPPPSIITQPLDHTCEELAMRTTRGGGAIRAPKCSGSFQPREGGEIHPVFVHESSFIRHPSRHRSRCPPAARTACPCCSPSTAHRSRSSKPIALLLK